jgi:hypothetical protein
MEQGDMSPRSRDHLGRFCSHHVDTTAILPQSDRVPLSLRPARDLSPVSNSYEIDVQIFERLRTPVPM